MIQNRPVPFIQGFYTLHQLIRREIDSERERQRTLRTKGARGVITLTLLAVSILINLALFLTADKHPALFIIASYFLFMVYFITLFIPMDKQYRSFKGLEITRTLTKLRELGIIRSTDRFSRVFINAFFVNCRTLFYGFALLFSLDIVFAIHKYRDGTFTMQTAGIVIFQSAAIIVFYYLVWKWEPYSPDFFRNITGVKQKLVTKRFPQRLATFLLWMLGALALVGAFTAVILLPGITVQSVLSIDDVQEVSDLFLQIVILVISQYFILRYIHGITSLSMATRFSERKAQYLSQQIEDTGDPALTDNGTPPPLSQSDAFCEKTAILLESRIYQVKERTIWGTFPVYIINPDFSAVLDQRSLGTIIGLSPGTKTSPPGGKDTGDEC